MTRRGLLFLPLLAAPTPPTVPARDFRAPTAAELAAAGPGIAGKAPYMERSGDGSWRISFGPPKLVAKLVA